MLFILIPDVHIYKLLHMNAPLKKVSTVSFGTQGQLVTSELQNRLLFVRLPKTRKFWVHPFLQISYRTPTGRTLNFAAP